MQNKKEIGLVQFIADMYELKAKLIQPVDYRNLYVEPNIKYAVIQTMFIQKMFIQKMFIQKMRRRITQKNG